MIDTRDIRDALFDAIIVQAQQNSNIILLTVDMETFGSKKFQSLFPDRYVNVWVAEQNAINVAAGLAMSGKAVFVLGIGSFLSTRCYEQIKINLCSMNLDVRLIGVGAGASFSYDGCTHLGIADLGHLRSIAGLKLFSPSDNNH